MAASPVDQHRFRSHALYFLLFLRFLLSPAYSAHFKISRFNGHEPEIVYTGDAVASVGTVEFNNVKYNSRVGQALYSRSVRIWDSATGELSSFSTHFTFTIDTNGRDEYGNGMAFFLAPVGFQIPPNSAGGFLGLFNTTTAYSPSNGIVHVEFDSYPNEEWDPPDEHVGINNNSVASAAVRRWNASMHSAGTADVWIAYDSTTKNLSVVWTYKDDSVTRKNIDSEKKGTQENSSLSHHIDLKAVLPELVTIGFSAATGRLMERHILKSWEFHSSLDEGTREYDRGRSTMKIGLSVPLSVISFGAIAVFVIVRVRKNKSRRMINASIDRDFEKGTGPRRFKFRELSTATNNFTSSRKLGEGGFGSVFKGYLIDMDLAIAVKKMSSGSQQGKKEYVTEVKIISQIRHRNLVQLIGWCHDRDEFLLVYEYMPNGSLDSHLFGGKAPLSWSLRYRIAQGLASALLYLHEEWEACVIHRDIKPSNIMLDSSFNCKLGDFGLAQLMSHELGTRTTVLAGTLGYMAPEYVRTGKASKESDVYSFGVVALEIFTGRRSLTRLHNQSQIGLVDWVWDLYGHERLAEAVDENAAALGEEMSEAKRLAVVGLWCAHPDHAFRPTIRQALQVLNFEAPPPSLPRKWPEPMYDSTSTTSAACCGSEAANASSTIKSGVDCSSGHSTVHVIS